MAKNKMNRRDFLRIAALGTSGAILNACIPTSSEPTPTVEHTPVKEIPTVTWMVWSEEQTSIVREASVKAFYDTYPEMKSKVNLKFVSAGLHDADSNQALIRALSSGSGIPDIFEANYTSIPEFARAGGLLNLENQVNPWLDDILPSVIPLMQYDNEFVTIPLQAKPKIWFYRQDLFDAAGIDPAAVKTFADYMAAGEQFRAAHPNHFFMNLGSQPIHYWWMEFFSHWDDFRIANEDGTYNIVTDERVGKVYDWVKQMFRSDISLKVDDFSAEWLPALAEEKICGWLCASWGGYFLSRYASEQAGLWKLALWPEFSRTGSEAGGSVVAIPKDCQHPEEAWMVLEKWILQPEGAIARWQENNDLPPVTKEARAQVEEIIKKEGSAASDFFGKDYIDVYFKAMENFKVPHFDPSFQQELAIMRTHTEDYLADKVTLAAALAATQKDMESQIGNPYNV